MASGKMTTTAAGSFAVLPRECLDAILASLPPNCIPLAMRQLSKAWRQRFLQDTTVDAKGTTYLPAWAVLQALSHVHQDQEWQLLPALASRGDLEGMQQLAQRLQPMPEYSLCQALHNAVFHSHLDVLKWLVEEQGCQKVACEKATLRKAAEGAHVYIAQWLHENGCSEQWDEWHMAAAAGAGKLTMLQHLMLLECPWDESACEAAARGGHVEVLRCLKANGCLWDEYVFASAAECGQLEALRYLKDNECPWDEDACTSAVACGQLEALRWLRDNGCPWDVQEALHAAAGSAATTTDMLQYLKQGGAVLESDVMQTASECGELRTVQWLHEQGCPWDDGACNMAAQRGRIDMLQYLMEHGCPWYPWALYPSAAEYDQRAVLLWLREQGHAWTASICSTAGGCGNLQLLTWLREQSPPCPWDSRVVHALVADYRIQNRAQCLQYVLSNGCPWDAADYAQAQRWSDLRHVQWPVGVHAIR